MQSGHVLPLPALPLRGTLSLVASKSESNRALLLQALAGPQLQLHNLSRARDTQLLQQLLREPGEVLDARDAGTTLRFLTAWCAVAGRPALITGTPRMCQRPIGILVEALRTLGADISYEGEPGFPPHRIHGFTQKTAAVSIRGDVSSQYLSALLLTAPWMPLGLDLTVTTPIASRPYLDMTLAWMARFGLRVTETPTGFHVLPQAPVGGTYTIESDWSGAGYWYSLLALAGEGELFLQHLREDSLQGDRAIVSLFETLGVRTEFHPDGIRLTPGPRADRFDADFTHIPDQAQTFVTCCAGLGLPATFRGLHSLRIKETDRIAALQQELRTLGCEATVDANETLHLPGTPLRVHTPCLHTYDDHRMAMAFAPLRLLGPLSFDDPAVVAKSYPNFWDDWSRLCPSDCPPA